MKRISKRPYRSGCRLNQIVPPDAFLSANNIPPAPMQLWDAHQINVFVSFCREFPRDIPRSCKQRSRSSCKPVARLTSFYGQVYHKRESHGVCGESTGKGGSDGGLVCDYGELRGGSANGWDKTGPNELIPFVGLRIGQTRRCLSIKQHKQPGIGFLPLPSLWVPAKYPAVVSPVASVFLHKSFDSPLRGASSRNCVRTIRT